MARQIDMEISIDTTKSEIKMQKLQDELRRDGFKENRRAYPRLH